MDNEQRGTVERLMAHVGDDRWTEVFLLVAGMLDEATEFCELYLKAIFDKFLDDTNLLAILRYCIKKAVESDANYHQASERAFLHCIPLNKLISQERNSLVNKVREIVCQLSRELAFSLDADLMADQNLSLALDLALKRIEDFDNMRVPENDAVYLAGNLAYARTLTRILGKDIALARALSLDSDLSLALNYSVEVSKRRNLKNMYSGLTKLIEPREGAKQIIWQEFLVKISALISKYRDLWDPYCLLSISDDEVTLWSRLSGEQMNLLMKYLNANLLLVRCLQVAYVPNRQALEDKILLPPELW